MLRLLTPQTTHLKPHMLPPANITGIYMHVPFCFHKCHYCDFYSITRQTPQRMNRFVDLMLREADLWVDGLGTNFAPITAFVGGGTPSLLPLEMMDRLLAGVRQRFDLTGLREFTVEANPATVTLEYCQMLKASGVDRLSFGAQSFNSAELKTLERHHEPDDVFRSIELARAAGFTRLNLDLIFAIPGQNLPSWQSSLETALGLGTTHLSCYALTYEPSTPMAVRRRLGHFKSAAEELELEMLQDTRDRMVAAHIPPYEISNFAAAGHECQHNLNYWRGGNYLGLGPSAASHVEGWRWKNRPHLGEWETAVDGKNLPAVECETLSPLQRTGEIAMLMLRLEAGLDLEWCGQVTGIDAAKEFGETIERLENLNLIDRSSGNICLTRQGIAVADAIAGEFVR